jgi:hypothetical protein
VRRITVAVLALGLAMSAGCSDKSEKVTASTTPTTVVTTSTTAPRPEFDDCPGRTSGSSPAGFDPTSGVYAAQALTVLGDHQVQFDVVQWLGGEEAHDAYFRDSGDETGPPNDYYIVNQSKELRSAQVADDALILVLTQDGYANSLHRVPLSAVGTDRPERTFWLTFDAGVITGICHQYRP